MIYTESSKPFSEELFLHPTSSYRGAPFWSWNCDMTKEIIQKQILLFKKMGMGGFHIHVRIGLKNKYLGDEFMELVRYCNEVAKENGMLCWLYDEDRYPSGTAGGLVTQTIKYRERYAQLTRKRIDGMETSLEQLQAKQERNEPVKGCLLREYDICLEHGYLKEFRCITHAEEAKGKRWYLYLTLDEEAPRKNYQTYLDVFNEEAVRYFIEVTHKKYWEAVGGDFGKSIPAIFTDEPRFPRVKLPQYAEGEADILLPFTDDLPEDFAAVKGMDFYQVLPEIIWNRTPEAFVPSRYHFYDYVCERYVRTYSGTIGAWCREHGIAMTGHVLSEETLEGQAGCQGEVMRFYRDLTLPGVDILCDRREFSTVKQAASSAHQYDREGVISELYGVTHWDFDFKGHKLGGDWQAALGVTTRTHHLAWASMEGESKRDYPAAIGWQSPWFEDYPLIEDHFARVNTILTRGKPLIQVGVIHPIETMWNHMGPADQEAMYRKGLETDFQNLTKWLLTGLIDYDYIAEESLPKLAPEEMDQGFTVGAMCYQVILVPSCMHLRKTTLTRLISFAKHGGMVLFAGKVPAWVEEEPVESIAEMVRGSRVIPLTETDLMEAISPFRQVEVRRENGERAPFYVHQIRVEEDRRWLFLAQAYTGMQARSTSDWERRPLHDAEKLQIAVKGNWQVKRYDTLTGQSEEMESQIQENDTLFTCHMYGNDSLMVCLTDRDSACTCSTQNRNDFVQNAGKRMPETADYNQKAEQIALKQPAAYRMEEPNVYLLDRCTYALDDGSEQEACEILRMNQRIRRQLGYEQQGEASAQPYVSEKPDLREHLLHLKFQFHSEVAVDNCKLALEGAAYTKVEFNGEVIAMNTDGYYVDECIQTVSIGTTKMGTNELILHIQYGEYSQVEWMYLLGEFGVKVMGSNKVIFKKPEALYFGSYTEQGLPFYTGNLTYQFPVKGEQKISLQVPYYAAAALKVSLDGEAKGYLAFLPDELPVIEIPSGEHLLEITCLGHRYNGFGQLHMIGDDLGWIGGDSWRTEGNSWADEYQLKPMGILRAPAVWRLQDVSV